MKTLYIDGGPETQIQLDEVALAVSRPGEARRLFPLSRLHRVVSRGPVGWYAEATYGCLRGGISLHYVSPAGESIGIAIPVEPKTPGPAERVMDFLSRPHWRREYDDWHRALERRLMLPAVRRAGLAPQGAVGAAVRGGLLRYLAQEGVPRAAEVLAHLQGLLMGRVMEQVHQSGLAVLEGRFQRRGVAFRARLNELLVWRYYLDVSMSAGYFSRLKLAGDEEFRHKVTEFFEERGRREDYRIRRLLNEWIDFVSELT